MTQETTQMIIEATQNSITNTTATMMLPMAGFLFFFGTPLVFAAMLSSLDN